MHPFPHQYHVSAEAQSAGAVTLKSPGLAALESEPPVEFDGPGNRWSPETLLVGAVADCFVHSFKAVAAASKFAWVSIGCNVDGKLDRIERSSQFTQFDIQARLTLAASADQARAQQLLEKAKQICLISNSLKGEFHLSSEIVTEQPMRPTP
jgi:organic hydroperoxide reductase OsmC/OhrA